jgi:hypothetical protein
MNMNGTTPRKTPRKNGGTPRRTPAKKERTPAKKEKLRNDQGEEGIQGMLALHAMQSCCFVAIFEDVCVTRSMTMVLFLLFIYHPVL